jgi:hypothetical protein
MCVELVTNKIDFLFNPFTFNIFKLSNAF